MVLIKIEDQQAGSSLTKLPQEIFNLVLNELNVASLGALNSTCTLFYSRSSKVLTPKKIEKLVELMNLLESKLTFLEGRLKPTQTLNYKLGRYYLITPFLDEYIRASISNELNPDALNARKYFMKILLADNELTKTHTAKINELTVRFNKLLGELSQADIGSEQKKFPPSKVADKKKNWLPLHHPR